MPATMTVKLTGTEQFKAMVERRAKIMAYTKALEVIAGPVLVWDDDDTPEQAIGRFRAQFGVSDADMGEDE